MSRASFPHLTDEDSEAEKLRDGVYAYTATKWWTAAHTRVGQALNWGRCPVLRELLAWEGSQVVQQRATGKGKPRILWEPEAGERLNQRSQERHPHMAGWSSALKDQGQVGQRHSSCRDRISTSPQAQRHRTT